MRPGPPGLQNKEKTMSDFHLRVGDTVTFEKTVGESDVYLFAGLTGDLAPNHINEKFMGKSKFGHRALFLEFRCNHGEYPV